MRASSGSVSGSTNPGLLGVGTAGQPTRVDSPETGSGVGGEMESEEDMAGKRGRALEDWKKKE